MATWIVGDIHGWPTVFDRLLKKIELDPQRDRLWLVGDLVNRGPDSLGMLRRARELDRTMDSRFVSVLGNHDLHLLAAAAGLRSATPQMRKVLKAPDAQELIRWLVRRPVLHTDPEVSGVALVHAGLWPSWTLHKAEKSARRVEKMLRGKRSKALMKASYDLLPGRKPSPDVGRVERRARDLFAFVHVRMLETGGKPCSHKGKPEDAPKGCRPWYAVAGRRSQGTTIAFGHWAALGLRLGPDWLSLDSGCSWGRELTAVRLEDRRVVQVSNPDAA